MRIICVGGSGPWLARWFATAEVTTGWTYVYENLQSFWLTMYRYEITILSTKESIVFPERQLPLSPDFTPDLA
jgi:hypothetical protein